MIADLFKALVLGVCCAILTLFVQAPLVDISTTWSIAVLTFIEEAVRFLILFFAIQRAVFFAPERYSLLLGGVFGVGFAGVESLLLASPPTLHLVALFAIHITLSALIALILIQKRLWITALGFLFVFGLHATYNLTVFLFA